MKTVAAFHGAKKELQACLAHPGVDVPVTIAGRTDPVHRREVAD
jgi:hypothetical protein